MTIHHRDTETRRKTRARKGLESAETAESAEKKITKLAADMAFVSRGLRELLWQERLENKRLRAALAVRA